MTNNNYLFTSESVSEGHPDKICDQISDAVLDTCIKEDPDSRVACESFTTTGMVLVSGEITTKAYGDIRRIVRGVIKKIGYDKAEYGLDYESMSILNTIHSQSPDISQGVTAGAGLFKEQGAGDQGMMFGFACNDNRNELIKQIKEKGYPCTIIKKNPFDMVFIRDRSNNLFEVKQG